MIPRSKMLCGLAIFVKTLVNYLMLLSIFTGQPNQNVLFHVRKVICYCLENDPAPVCVPLAQKGDHCTNPLIVRYMGGPRVMTKVFTGYCPCSAGLLCTGNGTKYCT